MKNYTYILLTLSVFTIIYSCGKDPLPPVMQVTPQGIHIAVDPNQILEFSVHAFSDETELRNIVITRKVNQGITTTLIDTLVSGLVSDFYYHYTVSDEDDQALISFTVYNSKGESGNDTKRLFLNNNDPFLEETQGHSLFSRYSIGSPNAFNIGSSTFYQTPANPDSILIDLIEYDLNDDNQLSYTFTSWSGMEFVKNNAFNYAEATNALAEDSYESSTAVQIVNNINIGDLLIVKYDIAGNKFAVIKITGVNNLGDDEQNNYTFNLKK